MSIPPPGPEMAGDPSAAAGFAAQGTGYDAGTRTAGVLLTIALPFISLIAALVLRGSEADPRRRASLRAWGIASGVWLGAQVLAAMIAIAAIANSAPQADHTGPCIGGPAPGSTGEPVGHGNYRFDCVGGGSTIVHAP